MGRAAIYIDGGYLDKVLYHNFHNRRIDYDKLVSEMAAPDDMLRAYYYHCLPHRGNNPSEEERGRYGSMHRFVTALGHLPRFEVRLGRIVMRGYSADGTPIFIQKRVDCMIGVDMALLAAKGKITNVGFLSGDSDLIPAIEAVKREGVLVTLWHGAYSQSTSPSRELVEICDERREINEELINRIARA